MAAFIITPRQQYDKAAMGRISILSEIAAVSYG